MKSYMVLLGMLLLLALPGVFAADPAGTSGSVDMWVRTIDNQTNAKVDVSTMIFHGGQSPAAIADAKAMMVNIVAVCQAQSPNDITGCVQQQSRIELAKVKYPVNFTSIQQNFTFEYYNQYKQGGPDWVPIPGCEKVESTIQSSQPVIYDPSGKAIPLYTATMAVGSGGASASPGTCILDKNLYAGRTINIRILPYYKDAVTPLPATTLLSDASTNAMAMFTSALTRAFNQNVVGGVMQASSGQTVQCVSVFLILGLLLASMYFAGKSPITLLDITTPRLPSPKGLSASGQVIAPFGYTEMKRVVGRKTEAAVVVANTVRSIDGRKLSASANSEIDKLAGRIGGTGKEADEARAIFKGMATAHLKNGGKVSDLKNLAKSLGQYSESDYASLKQILNKIERQGGRDALLAKTLSDFYQSRSLMESLSELTYKPGKVGEKVQTVLRNVSGIDRFTVVGPIVTGSYDAAARSMKMLAKSTKASVVHGAQFVRETGKLAVQTVGGRSAMADLERKAKTSATYSTIYKQLTAKPAEIKLGTIMPVSEKMAHLYQNLHAEVEKDQIRYLLKQIYKKMGANVAAVTDHEIMATSSKFVDLAGMTHYQASAKMAAVEGEIHAILANGALSIVEKRDRMEGLLKSMGGHMDASYLAMKAQSDRITQDQSEGHVKLMMLQELLDRENNALKAAREGEARLDDKYYSMVGRGGLHGSDMWEVSVLRRAIYDHENGYATKETTLKDIMSGVILEFRNRMESLNASATPGLLPELMRDKTLLAKKAEDTRKLLSSVITDKGEAAMKELTGKNRHTATIYDFLSVLYGHEYMSHQQGLKDVGGGIYRDKTTGKRMFWEDEKEIGPQKNWWKVDMDRNWLGSLTRDTRGDAGDLGTRGLQLTVAGGVQATFERAYTSPSQRHSGWAAEVDRMPGSRNWSPEKREMELKKVWLKNMFEDNIHNTFNDRFAMNAYHGTTNETTRFQMSAAAALLSKALRDAGFEERHTDVRFLETMDVTNPKHMERFRYMIGTRYKTEFEQVLKKGVTFDDIAKSNHAWVMTQDGSYVPYRDGMPLSPNDRVLGGHVVLRDDKGVPRRYSPDDVRLEDPRVFKGRDDLAMAFNRVAGSPNKEEWKHVIDSVMDWARPGGKVSSYEREKVLGAVLWRYSNTTYDYQSYWNKSAVTLVPRHEATPLAPSLLRDFGVEAPGLMKTLKPLRDFGQLVGQWMERTAMSGAGDLINRSYDSNPKSQILKMMSWRLSSQILTTDWNDLLKDATSEHDRKQLATAYRNFALTHGAFHQTAIYTWDRNPWRSSTSHGAQQSWASLFQYGPNMTYSMKQNLGTLSKAEYVNFMLQGGWAAAGARKAIMPYQRMIAGPQRSLQGYAGPHDWNPQNVMESFGTYTPPRLLEAVRGYNPMSFSSGLAGSRLTKIIGGANYFESRAEKAQLVGYEHSQGLFPGRTSGVSAIYKGVEYLGRYGMGNPAGSYTDTKFNEQIAPQMAEYALKRMGPMSGFYQNDDVVRTAGLQDTTRRTVSAEALAIKRQQELMGFGILKNPLMTWFNPVLFPFHMGIPGYPTTMSPKELIGNFVNKWRSGRGSGGNLEQSAKSMYRRTADAMNRAFSPSKASLSRFCACGRPGIIGNACVCGKRF